MTGLCGWVGVPSKDRKTGWEVNTGAPCQERTSKKKKSQRIWKRENEVWGGGCQHEALDEVGKDTERRVRRKSGLQ